MRALVVYESLFGNTKAIGESIARSLRTRGFDAHAAPVSSVDPAETTGFDLLVVGGPTHAHGMSSAGTRKVAATDKKNDYAEPTVAPGLRTWIKELPEGGDRLAAAFDTRFDKSVLLTGSAARGIARRLESRGYALVTRPESFFVTEDSLLVDDEQEHAVRWAARLSAAAHEAMLRHQAGPVGTR